MFIFYIFSHDPCFHLLFSCSFGNILSTILSLNYFCHFFLSRIQVQTDRLRFCKNQWFVKQGFLHSINSFQPYLPENVVKPKTLLLLLRKMIQILSKSDHLYLTVGLLSVGVCLLSVVLTLLSLLAALVSIPREELRGFLLRILLASRLQVFVYW